MKNIGKMLGVFVLIMVAMLCVPNSAKAAKMSDEFKSHLNKDGEFVVNASKGTTEEDLVLYLDFIYSNLELPYMVCWDKFADDLNSFEFGINCGDENEEKYTVKVKYNYDEKINQIINTYLNSTLKGKTNFKVSDLELVSYWLYNAGGPNDVLANYSGELKKLLDYKNIQLFADGRAGNDDKFITSNMGFGTFQNNEIIYKLVPNLGATAEHIIYVDENVGNSKEEITAAVQKRIDDYFGKGKVNILFGGESIYDLYVDELDWDISDIESRYNPIKTKYELAQTNQMKYCSDANYDANLCIQYQNEFNAVWPEYMSLTTDLENAKGYKKFFVEEWNDPNGDYTFLKNALNDWYFLAEITTEDSTRMYHFTVQKDSSKMVEPIVKTIDSATKVEISTTSILPLDTTIQANELISGSEYKRIVKILNLTDSLTFDLKLYSNSLNKYITKLEDGTFEVKIPIPKDFKGKDLVVYYVDADGKKEEYKVEIKDGYAVFKTTHFSIYTLGYKENPDSVLVENPKTFDNIGGSITMGMLSLIGLVGTTMYLKRKNKVRA